MSKIYVIQDNNFKYNKITLQPASFWKGVIYKHDGLEIKWKRHKAILKDDNGREVEVSKTSNPFDPSPWVMVDGNKHYPMGKIPALEQFFIYLPLGLLAVGGAIGGGLGGFASVINATLMRDYKDSPLMKYGLSLLTCLLATLVWYFTALMINTLMSR